MKKIVTLFISALFATAAVAQPQVRYIKTPRFARPLVERWIAEYNNSHSDVKFQIAQGQAEQQRDDDQDDGKPRGNAGPAAAIVGSDLGRHAASSFIAQWWE